MSIPHATRYTFRGKDKAISINVAGVAIIAEEMAEIKKEEMIFIFAVMLET